MQTNAIKEQPDATGTHRKLSNLFKGDKIIWIIFFLLCTISVVEVYSSSSALGFKSGNYWSAATFHTMLLLVGTCVMVFTLNIPCRYFKLLTTLLYPLSIVLLLWVLVFGTKTNDSARWIPLPLGFSLQPSELAKGAVVLATAQILSGLQTDKGAAPKAFYYILGTAGVVILLILPENFSTAALLGLTVFIMMVIGRVPTKQIATLFSAVMAIVVLALVFVFSVGETQSTVGKQDMARDKQLTEVVNNGKVERQEPAKRKGILHRMDLWKARITKFVNNEEVAPEDFDLNADGQVGHANIAISNGGLLGVGPGNSVQRDFLPLAFSDFIFAIITEEIGWIGSSFVVLLYIMLLFRTGYIARRCINSFPAYLAMGLAVMIVLQALFNMCVAVGLGPVTGQPLPLVSKGGTSSIINCFYIGMILSISRTAQQNEDIEIVDI